MNQSAANLSDASPPADSISERRPVIAQVMGAFEGGGAERLAANLAGGLGEAGATSICLAIRRPGEFAQALSDVTVLSLDINSKVSAITGMQRLRQLIREHSIDLLHVHGHDALPYVVLATRCMQPQPRIWFTWHDSGRVLAGPWRRRMKMKWALRRCEIIWGASQSIVDRLSQQLPGGPPMAVFSNGIEGRPMTAAQTLDQATILWLARFVPSKRPEAAIRAAAALKAAGFDFRMILAGGATSYMAWYEQQLVAMIRELNVEDVVELPGWISDIGPLLDQANIGLQTSASEGLSLSLLEQMTAGMAVVATDVGDTRNAINNDAVGLLIPDDDQAALEQALRRLLENVALRREMGEAARQRCREHFSIESMAATTLRHFANPTITPAPPPTGGGGG